jgi:hypothetical protein
LSQINPTNIVNSPISTLRFDFTKAMAEATDAELIKILTVDRESHQEMAVKPPEIELSNRKVPVEQGERTKEIQFAQKNLMK